jgi:hypothetical protein
MNARAKTAAKRVACSTPKMASPNLLPLFTHGFGEEATIVPETPWRTAGVEE